MMILKVIEELSVDTDQYYLVTADELADLRKKSAAAMHESLLGVRWGIKDIIERLDGYNRYSLMQRVLIPNKERLMDYGAVLAWSNDRRGKYVFRATRMAQWLEDNLEQITQGGWQ